MSTSNQKIITNPLLTTPGAEPEPLIEGNFYLGVVVSNNDPTKKNRVTAHVPQVLGTGVSAWALPLLYHNSAPAPNTQIFVSFVGGNRNVPVYLVPGAFINSGDLPADVDSSSGLTLLNPSGDTTGATDIVAINNALSTNGFCYLNAGKFYINAPILTTPGTSGTDLRGFGATWTTQAQGSPVPTTPLTTIVATSTFSGAAAIQVKNNGSAAGTNSTVSNLAFDGTTATSGTFGYQCQSGAWGNNMVNVYIKNFPSKGASLESGSFGHHWNLVKLDGNGNTNSADGVSFTNCTDSIFEHVQVIGSGHDGWNFTGSSGDARLIACSAENSASIGYNIAIGGIQLIGCRTNQNTSHGISCNSTSGGNQPVLIDGCRLTGDGANGTDKGININNPGFPVMIGDTYVQPDSNNNPAQALAAIGATTPLLAMVNCMFWGNTTSQVINSNINANTHTRLVTLRTGSQASPSSISVFTDQ